MYILFFKSNFYYCFSNSILRTENCLKSKHSSVHGSVSSSLCKGCSSPQHRSRPVASETAGGIRGTGQGLLPHFPHPILLSCAVRAVGGTPFGHPPGSCVQRNSPGSCISVEFSLGYAQTWIHFAFYTAFSEITTVHNSENLFSSYV